MKKVLVFFMVVALLISNCISTVYANTITVEGENFASIELSFALTQEQIDAAEGSTNVIIRMFHHPQMKVGEIGYTFKSFEVYNADKTELLYTLSTEENKLAIDGGIPYDPAQNNGWIVVPMENDNANGIFLRDVVNITQGAGNYTLVAKVRLDEYEENLDLNADLFETNIWVVGGTNPQIAPGNITGNDILNGMNAEDDNTGDDNTGDDNTGDDNTGDDNTGDDNTNTPTTGDANTLVAISIIFSAFIGCIVLKKKKKIEEE